MLQESKIQTTAIPAESMLSFQNNVHIISLERGDFQLSIGSLNNKFPYMVEGLLNILQSAQHGGKSEMVTKSARQRVMNHFGEKDNSNNIF